MSGAEIGLMEKQEKPMEVDEVKSFRDKFMLSFMMIMEVSPHCTMDCIGLMLVFTMPEIIVILCLWTNEMHSDTWRLRV